MSDSSDIGFDLDRSGVHLMDPEEKRAAAKLLAEKIAGFIRSPEVLEEVAVRIGQMAGLPSD